MNFELVLFILVCISGIIVLIDKFILPMWCKETAAAAVRSSVIVAYARSFFPIFLNVLLLRSFLIEPFWIPSGSLEPTLLTGDFVFVNKYQYGMRWPLLNRQFITVGELERGNIAVFRSPVEPGIIAVS